MAEAQQHLAGGDLFEGLGIDYSFLGDPTTTALGSDGAQDAENAAPSDMNDQTLFEAELLGEKSGGDMLAPLAFSFGANGTPTAGGADGVRYRVAPQHKHKRVRSNPDVIQNFAVTAAMMLDANGQAQQRPSLMMGMPPTVPIGPVEVTSPVGFAQDADKQAQGFQEMDEFLQELSWSELPTNGATAASADAMQSPLVDSSALPVTGIAVGKRENMVAYRAQRIQEGVNELKMKRKRPTASHHARHNSNPVDLLHNLDQFRMLAQQTKQQQQQQQQPPPMANASPMGANGMGMGAPSPFANPFGGFHDPSTLMQQQQQLHPQQGMMGIAGNGIVQANGAMNGNQFGFQVPPQIASGAARSLHNRRSSMGSSMPPRSRRPVRSSGLSMDMSQMNLSFLSVPEEEFQQQLQQMNQEAMGVNSMGTSTITNSNGSSKKKNGADDAGRKLYKCGRCGQPKVGHVCTMPDQRNNWSQVDLEVTKGLKVMRINCHILPVKNRWVPQHEDNM